MKIIDINRYKNIVFRINGFILSSLLIMKNLKIVHIELNPRNYSSRPSYPLLDKAIYSFKGFDWANIITKCKGKSGIYAFINNINGNIYIGSSVCLYNRLRDYNQPRYLKIKSHFPIVRALNKYGSENFTIVILEITDSENLIRREQKWINDFKPLYNILRNAGNSAGYIHTERGKEKISKAIIGKERSEEVRKEISKRQTGFSNTFFGKRHTEEAKALIRTARLNRVKDPKPGFKVEVLDTLTNTSTIYKSLRAAAKALGVSHGHLSKFDGKVFKNQYLIIINKNA